MPVSGVFLRTRKKLLLAKLESTYGTPDGTLTGASHAILTQSLSVKPVIEYVERKTDRGAMGGDLSLHTNRFLTFEFDVDLQSSGTPGTPPAWGLLLKACGFAPVTSTAAVTTGTIAADADRGATTVTLDSGANATAGFYVGSDITVTNVNGDRQTRRITAYTAGKVATISALTKAITSQSTYSINGHLGTGASATSSTITLTTAALGASGVNDFYVGGTIKITNGNAKGSVAKIIAYDGATKIATLQGVWDEIPTGTPTYAITGYGGVLYTPTSSSFDSLTLHGHMDGQLRAATGCRGTMSLKLSPKNNPLLHFVFTGLWADPVALADPVPVTTTFKMPVPVSDANTPTFTWMGKDLKVYEYDLDIANDVKFRDVINAQSVSIIDRKPMGNITIEAPDIATSGEKNWWVDTFDNEAKPLNIVHGLHNGSIIEIYAPRVQCFNPTDGDQDGVLTMAMKMSYLPVSGNDEIAIIAR